MNNQQEQFQRVHTTEDTDAPFSIDWLASTYGQSLVQYPGFEERLRLARMVDALLLLGSATSHTPDIANAKHAALVLKDMLT